MIAERAIDTHATDSGETPDGHRGRPRSMEARRAILDAARRLLMHTSLRDLSIEAIAKRAGVGKTTIYRWWPNKSAVVMEAFSEQPGLQNIVPTTASATDAVRVQMEKLLRQLRGQNGRILANIIAEGQSSKEALDLFYSSFLNERLETLRACLEDGRLNGEFPPALDIDIALDMILGPVFFRLMTRTEGLDDSFTAQYPQQAVAALRAAG